VATLESGDEHLCPEARWWAVSVLKEHICHDAQCTSLWKNVGLLFGQNCSAALSRKPMCTGQCICVNQSGSETM